MQKKEYTNTRKYEAPEAEIIRFDREDIIRTSGTQHETRLPFITGSSGLTAYY